MFLVLHLIFVLNYFYLFHTLIKFFLFSHLCNLFHIYIFLQYNSPLLFLTIQCTLGNFFEKRAIKITPTFFYSKISPTSILFPLKKSCTFNFLAFSAWTSSNKTIPSFAFTYIPSFLSI